MAFQNKCQLIIYPNGIGRDLKELETFLNHHLQGAIYGVHLLPFFPSSGDRGFAPLTYSEVDPVFGAWEDVDRLGRQYDLMVDFMVNHISRRSVFFQDFLEKGGRSQYSDCFLRLNNLTPDGELDERQIFQLFKRKAAPPWLEVQHADGSKEKVWCTFGEEQIDLNVESESGKQLVWSLLRELVRHNIKIIRLDAVGYVIKRLGASCFMVEPETSLLLETISRFLAPYEIEILPEIHAQSTVQLELARRGYWVYDFNLPLLVLQALYDHDSRNLSIWLNECPRKQFTTLDTHDGLPLLDVQGVMSTEEIERTKERLFSQEDGLSRYSLGQEYGNWNQYQLNSTYYSALGGNDDSYLTARAIQLFAPGIPQIYYVGLLAGRNDFALAESTKKGRNLNRHNYSLKEAEGQLQLPVVQRLLRLMRFRNEHPSFSGQFSIELSKLDQMLLRWEQDGFIALLQADLGTHNSVIDYCDPSGVWNEFKV